MDRIKSMEDYNRHYAMAQEDPQGYWLKQAESFTWSTPPTKENALDGDY